MANATVVVVCSTWTAPTLPSIRACIATILVPVGLTIAAIMIGNNSWFHGFYTYGWFTGSILGGLIYYFVANNEARSAT